MPDLPTLVPLIVSVLGALGVAGAITQWITSGKDRRIARASVLEALAAAELARWPTQDGSDRSDMVGLRTALRRLETAALITRLPRNAVVGYAQLAAANLSYAWSVIGEHGGGDRDVTSLPWTLTDLVAEAAETVSRCAWSSRATRWLWLRPRLRRVRRGIRVLARADPRFSSELAFVERGSW